MLAPPASAPPAWWVSAARRALWPVLLAGAILAAYLPFLPGVFVLDDFSAVLENPSIRRLWPPAAWLEAPAAAGVAGRPVANFTFALNYALGGLEPGGYHAGNILLHFLAAWTLAGLVRRTLRALPAEASGGDHAESVAGLIALIWAVHPLTSSAVGYVSQRTELLMAVAVLATLYAFRRHHESGSRLWAAAAVTACALGMAAKEGMMVAPLLVLLYDRTFCAGSFAAAWRAHGRTYLALAATWLILAGLAATSQLAERGVGFGLGVGVGDYALTASRALILYLKLALWPCPLVFDYGWSYVREFSAAWPALLAGGGLVAATLVALRRWPPLGFFGAWLLLLLALTTSFIPVVQQPVAESRMYLPLAGLVALAVAGAARGLRRRSGALGAAGLASALGLIVLTGHRGATFRTELALWQDTAAKQPGNARAHGNLSAAWLRAGRLPESIAAAEVALSLRPHYPEAHVNLGVALARLGRPAEAISAYAAALRDDPDHAAAHYNLGVALVQSGRPAEAVEHFLASLARAPGQASGHNNLAVAFLQLGRARESADQARAAIRLEASSAEANYNLGNALARLDDPDGAGAAYRAALRLQPGFAKAHNNLGVLALRAGRREEAVAHFAAALRSDPNYAEARRNWEAVRGR